MTMSAAKVRARDASILIVDDDPLFRQLASAALSSLGYATLEAEDGSVGWSLLNAHRILLAVIDLEMPNLNGFSLIESIRVRPNYQHLPIVVITSRDDAGAIQQAFEAGATSYLIKPVSWPTFGSHIQCLLRVSDGQRKVRGKVRRSDAGTEAITVLTQLLLGAHAYIADTETRVREPGAEEHFAALKRDVEAATSAFERMRGAPLVFPSEPATARNLAPLSAILAAMQIRVAAVARARSVPVSLVAVPPEVFVECDPAAVVDVLACLAENAVLVSAPGQNVLVRVTLSARGDLTIVISDDGPGLRPEVLSACQSVLDCGGSPELLFNTQVDGIESVRAVIAALQGQVSIDSKPRRGVAVTLTIPSSRVVSLVEAPDEALPS